MSSFGRNLKSDHNLPLTLPILNIRGVGKAEQKKKNFFCRSLYGGSKIKTAHPEYKSLFS